MSESLEHLYERARKLPPDARLAFADEACAGDPALREELLSLLEVSEDAEGFFGLLGGTIRDSPAYRDLAPGDEVGRYRILELVGEGGMGTVYRARDETLGRDAALKFLPWPLMASPEAKGLLHGEARAAAALQHSNICTIYEIDETRDGRPFIAIAFYEGETLRDRLRRGPVTPDEAVRIATEMARGLAAAHRRGVIHRDVKPGNVMLTTDGEVKLLDFGLATAVDTSAARPGSTPGTVAYMSPEQLRGEPLDDRTDLWSLGVVLYEMLAGRRPFRGRSRSAVIAAILEQQPPAAGAVRRSVPPPLDGVLARLLAKAPAERFDSAGLLESLATTIHGSPLSGAAPRNRRRALAGAATLAGAAALATLGYAALGGGEGRMRRLPATTAPAAPARPAHTSTSSPAAYELYVRASDQALLRSDSGVRQSVEYLEQAVAADTMFAAAHAALARAYYVLASQEVPGRPVDDLPELAERAAWRAIDLDASLAEAHSSLGLLLGFRGSDLKEGRAHLERAIELEPTDPLPYQWLAQLYLREGRPADALAAAHAGLQVDPLLPSGHAELAHALLANGRYEEALASLDRIADVRPPLRRTALYAAQTYAKLGMWSEAIAASSPDPEAADPGRLALHGWMLARVGRRDEAGRVRADLVERWRAGDTEAFGIAAVLAGLGELDSAFVWLDRALDDRSAATWALNVMEPIFDDLRADPRFESARERLGVRRP